MAFVSQVIGRVGLRSRPAHLDWTGSCFRNEPAAPSMTFGGDASASESEVRGKCVSAKEALCIGEPTRQQKDLVIAGCRIEFN